MKFNEEHKDEQLAKILEELNADTEALREKHKSITPDNGRQIMTVEIPKMFETVNIKKAKAMERMQEVMKSKIPGG